jgi:hypothetical protein
MSELPDELRELLNLARDGHDPTDPEARHRVRHAVAASLLLGGAGASGSLFPESQALASNTQTLGAAVKAGSAATKASQAGWLLFGSKAATLLASTLAVAGISYGAYRYSQQAPEAQPARSVPAAQAVPVVATPAPVTTAQAVEEPAAQPLAPAVELSAAESGTQRPLKARNIQPSAASLSAETALLRAASEALTRGDEQAALVQLNEHARRFPAGSLREERDGLRAIAECTRETAPSRSSAQKFLRAYPGSLLGARVSKACPAE